MIMGNTNYFVLYWFSTSIGDSFLLSKEYQILQNILFLIATISAGYHVIVLEGLGRRSITQKVKRFIPNSHILMGLAIGASLMGNFGEGALLIFIFLGTFSRRLCRRKK